MSSSRAMPRSAMTFARIIHLEAARKRLHDRFVSKYLDAETSSALLRNSTFVPLLSKVDIASALLADEMRPNYLEDARYRLGWKYQEFLDRFTRGRHDTFVLNLYQPALEAMIEQNVGRQHDTSPNTSSYLEAARNRLRQRFQDNFMHEKETTDNTVSADDIFVHFPLTADQIPETMASGWAQDAAIVITEARSPFEILHVNQASVGLCGYTKDEATGQTFTSLGINASGITEHDLTEEMMRSLAVGTKTSVQLTNLKKNGEMFTNHLRIAPVRHANTGEVVKYFGLLEDVTREAGVTWRHEQLR
mmetsp:Transcript_15229/g.44033  ORF Transcript_15229/g.44033 Transcript_15229/m.44033 type:complete len:305 (+) Transcript_15229:230-1144(+)